MNQYVGQALAVLKREKKLANTVGLILIVLCCTFIPALIAPIALLQAGFESVDALILFRPLYRVFIILNGLLNVLLNYGRNGDVRRVVRGLIRFPQCIQRVHPSHSLLRRGSAEKCECRRKIPWKAVARASARSHAQYGCDPGESFCN